MTERKFRKCTAPDIDVSEFELSLSGLDGFIKGLIDKYGETATLAFDGWGEPRFVVSYTRPETDNEMSARIKRAKRTEQARTAKADKRRVKDLKELGRLVKKYNWKTKAPDTEDKS